MSDNGLGMSLEDQANVFDEYVRLAVTSHVLDLGLSLSIANRLSKILDAEIKLESQLGIGTTVSICFVKTTDNIVAGNATNPMMTTHSINQSRTFMVVGTNPRNEFGGWADLVSSWAWRFVAADDVDSALLLLQTLGIAPDVIVFDNPEFSEIEIIEGAKKLGAASAPIIPCIVMGRKSDDTLPAYVHYMEEPILPTKLHNLCLQLIGTTANPILERV